MLALSPIMPPPLHLSWAPARPAQGEPLVALVLPLVAEAHPAPLAEERQAEPLVALVLVLVAEDCPAPPLVAHARPVAQVSA